MAPGFPFDKYVEPSAFKTIKCPRCADSTKPALVTVANTSPAKSALIFALSF